MSNSQEFEIAGDYYCTKSMHNLLTWIDGGGRWGKGGGGGGGVISKVLRIGVPRK